MRFIDTNVFLRYLTRDDEIKAEASYRLIQQLANGIVQATTSEAVICELAYVLSSRSVYQLSHPEVATRLKLVLGLRGLHIAHKSIYMNAVDVYEGHAFLDFKDAIAVALAQAGEIDDIVSYDEDFDRVSGVVRTEP